MARGLRSAVQSIRMWAFPPIAMLSRVLVEIWREWSGESLRVRASISCMSDSSGIEPVDAYVGARIRAFRKLRGFQQGRLANAIGVKFQQVQKYETGANRVSASRLVKIANALEVSVSDLFGDYAGGEAVQLRKQIDDPRVVQIMRDVIRLDAGARDMFAGLIREYQRSVARRRGA